MDIDPDDPERSERYYQRGRLIIRWVIIVAIAGFVFVVVDAAAFLLYWSQPSRLPKSVSCGHFGTS